MVGIRSYNRPEHQETVSGILARPGSPGAEIVDPDAFRQVLMKTVILILLMTA